MPATLASAPKMFTLPFSKTSKKSDAVYYTFTDPKEITEMTEMMHETNQQIANGEYKEWDVAMKDIHAELGL